jgi:hypothetical protein
MKNIKQIKIQYLKKYLQMITLKIKYRWQINERLS